MGISPARAEAAALKTMAMNEHAKAKLLFMLVPRRFPYEGSLLLSNAIVHPSNYPSLFMRLLSDVEDQRNGDRLKLSSFLDSAEEIHL
jgi:hypothetical protein